MRDIIKLSVVLCVIACFAGLAIAITNQKTKPNIELQKKIAEAQALKEVFPEGLTVTKVEDDTSMEPYWIGKKDDKIIGYAFKGQNRGYSSDIKFIIGVTNKGEILGLSILSQVETPGLGSRVEEVVSDKYIWNGLLSKKVVDSPWFAKQFRGLFANKLIKTDKSAEWHTLSEEQQISLKNENKVTVLTGATISTVAVTQGIEKVIAGYLSKVNK